MSTPRKIRIRTLADYGAGSNGFSNSYAFAFSDKLEDWMGSHNIEKKRETSHRHYITKRQGEKV